MGHGLYQVYSMTMGALAGSATVTLGRAFAKVYVEVASLVSVTGLDVYVARASGGTYYQLSKEVPNTTTVQSWSFTVASSAMANGRTVAIPAGFQFYKFIAADSAPTAAYAFNVICSDS